MTISGSSCQDFTCPSASTTAGRWAPTAGISSVVLGVQAPERTGGGTDLPVQPYGCASGIEPSESGVDSGRTRTALMLGSGNWSVTCSGGNSIQVIGTAAINSTTQAIQTNGGGTVKATNIYTLASGSNVFGNSNNVTPATPTATGVPSSDPYAGLPAPATGLPIPGSYKDGDTYPSNWHERTAIHGENWRWLRGTGALYEWLERRFGTGPAERNIHH